MIPGPIEAQGRERVNGRIDLGNALRERVDEIQRRNFAALQQIDDLDRAFRDQRYVRGHLHGPPAQRSYGPP